MEISIKTVTPELASTWLSPYLNKHNRPMNKKLVGQYAKEISRGDWKVNGETIKFSASGSLLDGQHRLAACVRANRSFLTCVVDGLPETAFDSIDVGRGRTARDILTIAKTPNAATVAKALRLIASHDEGGSIGHASVTKTQFIGLLEKHPRVVESADAIKGLRNKNPKLIFESVAVFCHYLFSQVDPVKTEEFFTKLYSGENLRSGDPILTLRNRMVEALSTGPHRLKEREQPIFVAKAWNSFYRGKDAHQFRLRKKEKMPDIEGMNQYASQAA